MKHKSIIMGIQLVFLASILSAQTVVLDTSFPASTYPQEDTPLGNIVDGLGTWSFNSAVRAVSTDGRSALRFGGNTSTTTYNFDDAYTNGRIEIKFNVSSSHTSSGYELLLRNGGSNEDIGSQLRLTGGSLTYYDGSAFVPIQDTSFTVGEEVSVRFIAYLDGSNAHRMDVFFNGKQVAENLVWRNDITAFSQISMRTSGGATGGGRFADLYDLQITHIPEPGTVATIAGFLGLIFVLIRKKQWPHRIKS